MLIRKMYSLRIIFMIALAILIRKGYVYSEPIPTSSSVSNGGNLAEVELNTCEEQLMKYRRFLLQAIISFEDVCDAYNARPPQGALSAALLSDLYHGPLTREQEPGLLFFRNYQPPQQRSEIWAFFKLLMAQFNDVEFSNVIREAVIQRCRVKSQMQHDEKRNSVVLGKKQRFHSWGGKRSQAFPTSSSSIDDANMLNTYLL